jgi:hypothetical protein
MPKGKDVKHEKWSNEIILFDDGWYSAIWGNYENSPKRRLGVRWNGQGNEPGFPSLFKHSIWFVEREFLEKPILLELYFQVLKYPGPETKIYLENIQQALSEV